VGFTNVKNIFKQFWGEIIILIKWLVSVTAGLFWSIFYAEFLRRGRWWQQPVQCREEGKLPKKIMIYVKVLHWGQQPAEMVIHARFFSAELIFVNV
jgi:hypothetical protein